MIPTFYLCLLAVVGFHFVFFSLVLRALRESESDPSLSLKIPRSI